MGRKSFKTIEDVQKKFLKNIRDNVRKANYQAVAKQVIKLFKSKETSPVVLDKICRDVIEPVVKSEGKEIPEKYNGMIYEYAMYLKNKADEERKVSDSNDSVQLYMDALEALRKIENTTNTKLRNNVRKKIDIIELIIELLKNEEERNNDVIEETADKIQKEDNNSKENQNSTYMDVIQSIFGQEMIVSTLNIGEIERNFDRTPRNKRDEIKPSKDRIYSDELKAEKRIEFFRENFDIDSNVRLCDKGIFSGCILMSIKNSDLVIVEKIFNLYADGTYSMCDYGSATYILPKNKVMDLVKMCTKKSVKGEMKKDNDTQKSWKPVRHDNRKWKSEVIKAVKQLEMLEEQTIINEDEEKTMDEESVEKEEDKNIKRFKGAKITKVKGDNVEINKQFVQELNQNIGGFLTDDIINQIVNRTASYTFENIYESKLQERIYKNLELLEIPDEEKDLEARKVLLVMKMTMKNFSALQRKIGSKYGIEEDELDRNIEAYTCNYEELIGVLKNGIENGMSYKEITQLMEDTLNSIENPVQKNNTEKIDESMSNEDTHEFSNDEEVSERESEEDEEKINTQEGEEDTPNSEFQNGAQRLLDDLNSNENINPLLAKLMQNMASLLTRMAEIEKQQKRVDSEIKKLRESKEKAAEELEQSRKEFREAIISLDEAKKKLEEAEKREKIAREQLHHATKNDREVKIELEMMEEESQRISNERKEIEEKIRKIEDALEL